MIIVSDTSVISTFFAIGEENILFQTYHHLIIPEKVYQELERLQEFGFDTSKFKGLDWLEVRQIHNLQTAKKFRQDLDPGEAEAIALAMELHADYILMDDSKGRKFAEQLGFTVVGCAGVLLQAKKDGHISIIKPILDRLVTEGGLWLKDVVYNNALTLAQE